MSENGGNAMPRMPLKIVVLAELTPRDLETGKSAEHRTRLGIDRRSFDDVMKNLDLTVSLDVEDRLTGGKEPLIVSLRIENLKSFRPGEVARQIPATRELLELCKALTELQSGKSDLSAVRSLVDRTESHSTVVERIRQALQAAPETSAPNRSEAAPTDPGGPSGLDDLLARVDTPDGAASSGADLDRLDAFVRKLVQSGGAQQIDRRAVQAVTAEVASDLSAQVDAILHHSEFRRLEAAWRGLRFFLDRVDFEEPIQVEVLSTGPDTLLAAFDEQIYGPESQGVTEEPVSLVVLDRAFGRTQEDIDLLQALAERGLALRTPILASAGAEFLGFSRAAELEKHTSLMDRFAGPEYTKWKGLRETDGSRWLGLTFNRFLLRPAYGPEETRVREFDYREAVSDEQRLWGNPAWGLASLAARSFARIGWCTDIMGQRASGAIDDLAVRTHKRNGGQEVSLPIEVVVSDEIERDLTNNGLIALTARLNSDRAYVRYAPSVHAPSHYQDPGDKARAKLQSTLPFQMFVSRILNYALMIERRVVPGRTPEQIATDYTEALRGLMATAGAVPPSAVQVQVLPNEDDPSQHDLSLKLSWPGFQSLPGAGALELRWPLAG